MKDDLAHPSLVKQEIGQDQVKEQFPPGVVIDKIDPRHPSRQEAGHLFRVVDEDVLPLLASCLPVRELAPAR